MPNPDQRNANEIIAESLLAIEGRLASIQKEMDDLQIIFEVISRYILKGVFHATQKPGSKEGDVRGRSGEVDTWHPEKDREGIRDG